MANNLQNHSGDEELLGWALIILIIMCGLIYLGSHHTYSFVWLWFRKFEFHFIAMLPTWIPLHHLFNNAYQWLQNADAAHLTIAQQLWFDRQFPLLLGLLPSLLLLGLGISLAIKYRKQHAINYTINSITQWMAKRFKWIRIYEKDCPETKDSRFKVGANNCYAQALSPTKFATIIPAPLTNYTQPIFDESDKRYYFDEDLAYGAFAAQLDNQTKNKGFIKRYFTTSQGKTYLNYNKTLEENFSQTEKRVYEIFIKRLLTVNTKIQVPAIKLIISKNNNKKLLNLSKKEQIVANLFQYHRYTRSFLMSLYELACKGQVQTIASLPWVAKNDRVLNLSLSSVGRGEAFCEAAGCYAHWATEKYLYKHKEKFDALGIEWPEVRAAVIGLKKYLSEICEISL